MCVCVYVCVCVCGRPNDAHAAVCQGRRHGEAGMVDGFAFYQCSGGVCVCVFVAAEGLELALTYCVSVDDAHAAVHLKREGMVDGFT
jgi:hypothetical protein